MRRIAIWVTCCLLLITGYTHAQSSPDAWPIVEHCVGSATKPPDDWHFDGTLLLKGFRPLHIYRQDWETPHIRVFRLDDIPNNGQLSPDNHWYATVIGIRTDSYNFLAASWKTNAIVVYNTLTEEKYTVDWQNTFSALHRLDGHGLYWLDNQHLLYSKGGGDGSWEVWFVINPFTGEVESWQGEVSPSQSLFTLSPDERKVLYWNASTWTLNNDGQEIELPLLNDAAWNSNSTRFVGITNGLNGREDKDLVTFDLQGKLVDHIFSFSLNHSIRLQRGWSPDNQYLLFASDHLYLADMTEKRVIDTCIPTRSPTVAWSPASHQFALIDRFDSKHKVQIFDLDRWARYVVAYHAGSVIGWRSDD
ncbi:MAG: hypothetical protein GC179_29890 [Anaerolineaceae bacterium]|nr:hypothetical protein [Anaerolineaceae bacterium]